MQIINTWYHTVTGKVMTNYNRHATMPIGYQETAPVIEEDIDKLRSKTILVEWSLTDQMEAHLEAAESPTRLEKRNALLQHVRTVKLQYPKKP